MSELPENRPEIPRPKILVVDDTSAKLIRNRLILKKLDCDVIEARSGAEALAAFAENEFAAIVLDVQMEGMDGFEVARTISQQARGRDVPIIFSTATYFDDANRIKAYGSGAVDYIIEPSDETILLSKARIFLELYRSKQELRWLLTERTRLEELARHEATHDSLTGLPNRRLFMDRLDQTLQRSIRRKTMFALFYIDIDDFKPVNDRYGHPAGDELLKAISQRMLDNLRKTDTVARFGGDEFAAILDEPVNTMDAMHKVEMFAQRLREPYVLALPGMAGPVTLVVGASIGVGLFPEDGVSGESLLRAADAALYRAKQQGKNLCLRTVLGSAGP